MLRTSDSTCKKIHRIINILRVKDGELTELFSAMERDYLERVCDIMTDFFFSEGYLKKLGFEKFCDMMIDFYDSELCGLLDVQKQRDSNMTRFAMGLELRASDTDETFKAKRNCLMTSLKYTLSTRSNKAWNLEKHTRWYPEKPTQSQNARFVFSFSVFLLDD